jgi:hypothetical protein
MKMLLLMLVGFSALTVEGEVTETPNSPVVIETPGSPVMIESALLGFDQNATSVVTLYARSAGPAVSGWRVRVYIYDAAGKPRGIHTRTLGSVGPEAQVFTVTLTDWFINKGDKLRVAAVTREREGREDSLPTKELACDPGFCAKERVECMRMCNRWGVDRFYCRQGRDECSSDCECK